MVLKHERMGEPRKHCRSLTSWTQPHTEPLYFVCHSGNGKTSGATRQQQSREWRGSGPITKGPGRRVLESWILVGVVIMQLCSFVKSQWIVLFIWKVSLCINYTTWNSFFLTIFFNRKKFWMSHLKNSLQYVTWQMLARHCHKMKMWICRKIEYGYKVYITLLETNYIITLIVVALFLTIEDSIWVWKHQNCKVFFF